jgi:hypothetical protein
MGDFIALVGGVIQLMVGAFALYFSAVLWVALTTNDPQQRRAGIVESEG